MKTKFLFLSIFIFSLLIQAATNTVYAQTWSELNKEAVRYYKNDEDRIPLIRVGWVFFNPER